MLRKLISMGIVRSLVVSLSVCAMCHAARGQEVSFRQDVAAILLDRCLGCHNSQVAEGGYQVGHFSAILKAGDSGAEPIVAGDAESELLRRLTSDDPDERMPAESGPLPSKSIELIRRWILAGAKFDGPSPTDHLASLLPVKRHPAAPERYARAIPITALEFIEDDILIAGYHEVLRWSVSSEMLKQRFAQIPERVYCIKRFPDANRIAVGGGAPGRSGEVRVLDVTSGQIVAVPVTTNDVILDLAIDPTQRWLAAGGADGLIHLVDLATLKVVNTISSHSDWVRSVAWNEMGELASASRDKTVKLFSDEFDRPIGNFTAHSEDVVAVAFAPDGKLVSSDAKGRTLIWKRGAEKGEPLLTSGRKPPIILAATSGVWVVSEGTRLKQFSWDGKNELVDLGSQSRVSSLARQESLHRLGVGGADGRVRVWDVKDRKLVTEFVGLPLNAATTEK